MPGIATPDNIPPEYIYMLRLCAVVRTFEKRGMKRSEMSADLRELAKTSRDPVFADHARALGAVLVR